MLCIYVILKNHSSVYTENASKVNDLLLRIGMRSLHPYKSFFKELNIFYVLGLLLNDNTIMLLFVPPCKENCV